MNSPIVSGGAYTDAFCRDLISYRRRYTAEATAKHLNSLGMETATGCSFTASNVYAITSNFNLRNKAKEEVVAPNVEPSFTMAQLISHKNLGRIAAKLAESRSAIKHMRRAKEEAKAAAKALNKLVKV